MSRGRKPNASPIEVKDNLDAQALQQANAASQVMSAASVEVMQAADLHQLVGRMQASHFLETVAGKMIAQTYIGARALLGKLGQVTVRNAAGLPETVSDIERFCELAMPVSARRCRQIVAAIDTLGTDLYEQAERIGFRARDYQALKALPSDDQVVVRKAIESGNLDDAIASLTELAARNEALRKRTLEAEQTLVAKDKVVAKRDKTIADFQEADERRNSSEASAQLARMRDATLASEQAIHALLSAIDDVMRDPGDEACALAARQTLDYITQALASAAESRGMALNLDDKVLPLQMQPIRDAVMARGAAKRSGAHA